MTLKCYYYFSAVGDFPLRFHDSSLWNNTEPIVTLKDIVTVMNKNTGVLSWKPHMTSKAEITAPA